MGLGGAVGAFVRRGCCGAQAARPRISSARDPGFIASFQSSRWPA